MATLALIIAVVALVIAIAAYRRTGGVGELQNQIQTLSSTTDSVRDRTADAVEGEVAKKLREQDRLLVTLVTGRGAILITFRQKVAEVDLLVAEGDKLTLHVRRFEPFVEDPAIQSVKKKDVS